MDIIFKTGLMMNTIMLSIANRISHLLPSTRCFGLKRSLYRMSGVIVGKNVRIVSSVSIIGDSTLFIGDNVWIGHETIILASAPISIESNVNIAPRCFIGTGTHEIDVRGASIAGKGVSLPVTIKEGAWLCANTTVIAGASIGRKSIAAAGAVIVKCIPDGEMWGGCPARLIKVLL